MWQMKAHLIIQVGALRFPPKKETQMCARQGKLGLLGESSLLALYGQSLPQTSQIAAGSNSLACQLLKLMDIHDSCWG